MEYDIFISYAHNDNIASREEHGWVDNFHIALYQYLTGKLGSGKRVKIWRDRTELKGNTLLNEALAGSVNNSLIFIPILSPNFLASEYSLQELNTFCNQPNVIQDAETRIFPVVKLPISAPPKPLDNRRLEFAFYSVDDYGEYYEELDPSFGGEFRNKFNQKVNDLAREIADFIRKNPPPVQNQTTTIGDLTSSIDAPPPKSSADVMMIYLAEPSPDLMEQYNDIKRDLEQRRDLGQLNFEFIFPNTQKPADAGKYIQQVRGDILKSHLAIHLIGKEYDGFPRGYNESYLQLRTHIATQFDGNPDFERLVWIPRNVMSEDTDYQNFIDEIRQEGVIGDGLLQDSFEEFKFRVRDTLMRHNKKASKLSDEKLSDELYDIVLSYAGEDRQYVEAVAKYLEDKEIKFFYDKFEESTLWGKDLSKYLEKIYRGSAKYCVVFISKHYVKKTWTMLEMKNILAEAIEKSTEYILPARFDDTEIPGLNRNIGFLDLTIKSPNEVGDLIVRKLGEC